MEIFWKFCYMDLSVADHCRRPAVDSDAYKESPSVGKDGHEAIYDFSVFVDCYRILCHLL